MLFIFTISILSTLLPLLSTHLMALFLFVDGISIALSLTVATNWMVLSSPIIIHSVEDLSFIVFNIEVRYTAI